MYTSQRTGYEAILYETDLIELEYHSSVSVLKVQSEIISIIQFTSRLHGYTDPICWTNL